MKLRSIILALLASGVATQVFAQYTEDAFKFSGTENSTTARFNGLGGQQTSLGGDLSSLYGNPAGLGMFSRSEFSLSTSFINNSNKADFLGNNNKSSFLNPNINNIGVVLHSPVAKTGNTTRGLLSMNFGIGYQKTNFFRNDLEFGGETYENGLSDYFTEYGEYADRQSPVINDPLLEAARETGLFSSTTTGPYTNNTSATSTQYQTINRKGGQSNVDLSLGLNFSNTFYLGFGLGIASVNYRSEELLNDRSFNELNNTDYSADFLKSYDTRGSGVNFKVGAIIKPVQELRLGFSLETPTYYNLDDNYYEEVSITDDYGTETGYNTYPVNYDLRTPLKLNGGISYIIGNKGLITADVSYRDYSNIHFTSDTDAQTDRTTNQQLNTWYKEVVNYGVGGEYKLTNDVALRAGYRFIADPNNGLDRDYAVNRYSGGIGYKFGNYFIDGAVQFYDLKSDYSAYNLNAGNGPRATINNNVTNVSLTFGARF